VGYQYTGSVSTRARRRRVNGLRCAAFALRKRFEKICTAVAPAVALLLAVPLLASAQGNPLRVRVTDRVDITRLTTLKGNTHALAQAKYDQGAAPPDLPMNRIMLLLKRSPEQESALQDLLVQQQLTSSASFHKWLTPDQFGQQFGPADADVQAVTSWLASFGFQSIKVSRGRNVVEFSGTASQVQSALHTSIHKYVVNGENHWANSSDPQVPAALAPVIAGFASLHDFHPKTAMTKLSRNVAGTLTSGPRPQVNLSGGRHALVPADFNKIYNIAPSMTGSGATIGIIASSNINPSDVVAFRSLWGLPPNPPTIIANGPLPAVDPGSGGEGEAILDATWAGAVAPAATIDLVVSEDTNAANGTDLSEFYIVDNNLADVMTESFQACESQFGSSLSGAEGFFGGMAEQAAAQGITFLVSSGDGGPDACDDPSTEPATITTPSVNILASTAFNVAVGGTMFNDVANPNTYWGTNAQNGGSALSYIPEDVWNESCTVAQFNQNACPASGLWSSGGGQSLIVSKPPWQAGVTGIPSANARFLPDVSMNAADHDGYILCIDGSCPNLFGIASGTSASVQVFGGVMALVVQKVGARVGIANYALYKLAAGGPPTIPPNSAACNASNTATLPAGTCIFNDVTVGNTNVPGLTGFSAGVGYDKTTGLGSVNVTNLVNNWSSTIASASATTLRLNGGNPVNITHGAGVSVQIAVTPVAPATATPTGDVSLISNNSSTDNGIDEFTLVNGSVNALANSTTLLPGGTYQVHAHYQGDGTFLGSDSTPVSVTVNPEPSQINFGIVVSTAASGCTATTVAYGSPYVLTVDVSDVNAASTPCNPNVSGSSPTGMVTLTDSFNGGAAQPLDAGSFNLNSFAFFEDRTIQLAAGTHTIKASYLGDNSFSASGPATGTITVTQAATTAAVIASQNTVPSGSPVTLTATVSTQSNATATLSQEPTGSVQFLLNGSNFGSPVTVTGAAPGAPFAQATASISPTLANGASVITAKYLGDTNYAASAVSASTTVTVGSSGINVSTGCSAIISIAAPGQTGSCLITATAAGGFTGTVTLSVASSTTPPGAVDVPKCIFGAPSQNFTAPDTITLSSGSQTGNATMTCSSQAASHILLRPTIRPSGRGWPLAATVITVCCFLFLLSVSRQRRWSSVPFAVLLLVVAAAAVACGGGSSGGGVTNPGTTTGLYTFTVTATPSAGAAQTTIVTLNVQ
jgi:subtilase family serine protease